MSATYHFQTAATSTTVDRERGVIYGVSLITSGITAKGHDLEVDRKTLEQMLSCAEAKGKIPVKWNHKTGADAVSGYLKNFRIEDKKLLGDWHLLKSHERFGHALELASEMPECLGLSTSFKGEDETIGERKFARCTELVSADLVAAPAANPDGFFEEKVREDSASVDSAAKGMADKNQSNGAAGESTKEFSLADVMAGINALAGRIDGIEQKVTSFESFQEDLIQSFSDDPDEDEEDLEDGEEGEGEGIEEVAQRQRSRRTEFSSGDEALQYLSEKLLSIEDAKEQAKIQRAFAAYDGKVESLLELNEQLALENAAMAEALTEFSESTGRVVQFAAGAEGYEHHIGETGEDGRPLTDFEARCKQFEADGKPETDAIMLAMKEDPKRYQRHLAELGVIAKRL